ncbi:MAG: protein-glutamate O-methyltransferase CheR [Oscillospiraceae bacterium]|nr:protein-glutamate O-methyltransferase CheR [Oscillospiraceae bacterium]
MEITDAEFQRLVKFIYDNFGINLSAKRVLVQGRLGNMIRERGFKNYNEYIDAVMNDKSGAEITIILNKLTTNHTFFMREPEHYTFMKEVILPYMKSVCTDHVLRIWSAACSSGEEVYTIAMLMDEFFGADKANWDTRILASDISQNVIGKAKTGIYQEEGMKGLSNEWKARYFNKLSDGNFEICQAIKDEVIFKTFNLMDPMPDKYKSRPFDLIFCRNVMIYFDAPTKQALVNRFYDVLKPGGYFYIGHAESINRQETSFDYIKPAIYRRPEKQK